MGKYAIISTEDQASITVSPPKAADVLSFRVGAAVASIDSESGATAVRWRRTLVAIAVHADAFRINAAAYLRAVAWRILGLRVRSRSRISMLASHSPRIYDLWIARDEPKAVAAVKAVVDRRTAIAILPVIDCREGSDGLEETLRSLRSACASSAAILIGGPARGGTIGINIPAELARIMDAGETWLCLLRPGDRLAGGAFTIYAGAAELAGEAGLIYADDDLLSPAGKRYAPHFKPCWNPDLFEHHDFLTGSCIVRVSKDELARVQGDRWERSLIGRAALRKTGPLHLPLVLHHRRSRPEPVVPGMPQLHLSVDVPTVTAIVPTRNHVELLRNCIEGLRQTAYPGLEILVVDNGSDESSAVTYLEALKRDGISVMSITDPFNFSALNNAAVKQARGELLCFLNNDVEMIDRDWLALLVRQAVRPDIGAVGARLLYPDGTIQHAGVFVGIGGAAGHGHRLQSADASGYFERARLPQRVSAVTAACLVVSREKFEAVGGFDEKDFGIAFNDVDLCMKLNDRGWTSFYEPRATLIHHESKSRGCDRSERNRDRFAAELDALKRKWQTDKRRDPYHHPHLSRMSEQFLIEI